MTYDENPYGNLSDVELVEFVLGPKAKEGIAETLVQSFGNFQEVVAATPVRLSEHGLSDHAVTRLKKFHTAATRMHALKVLNRPAMSSWADVTEYLTVKIARLEHEEFHVLFVDRKNNLIADERMSRGTIDHAPVYPREVVKRALELNAASIILSHNHPSGDPTPSRADIDITRKIVDACKAIDIRVLDHVIVGRNGTASMKALGLI